MEKLLNDFSIGLFFWQTLLFLLLLFLLRKFAWKPILNAVDEREQSIENALNEAAKAKEEMKNLQEGNEALLKEARIERDLLMKEARDTRDNIVTEAKDKALAEGAIIIAAAKEEIEIQKQAAIADIKTQVAELSIEIAEKVVRKNLSDDSSQKDLVNTLLNESKLN